MKRPALLLLFFLILAAGCGRESVNYAIAPGTRAALLILDKEQQSIPIYEWKEMQRVEAWMRKDLLGKMRARGIIATYLTGLNEYSSPQGTLIILNIKHFSGGDFIGRPRRQPTTEPARLIISYRILDGRGALLADWQTGASAAHDGTKCAETLNRRFMHRFLSVLSQSKS